jgi:hypothetical protein
MTLLPNFFLPLTVVELHHTHPELSRAQKKVPNSNPSRSKTLHLSPPHLRAPIRLPTPTRHSGTNSDTHPNLAQKKFPNPTAKHSNTDTIPHHHALLPPPSITPPIPTPPSKTTNPRSHNNTLHANLSLTNLRMPTHPTRSRHRPQDPPPQHHGSLRPTCPHQHGQIRLEQ